MATKRIPKEQYDQLYYYVGDDPFRKVMSGADPLRHASPRRYATIQEVRKAALAKSKKEWSNITALSESYPSLAKNRSMTVHVFKGRDYLGFIEYNVLKGKNGGSHDYYDGLWYPVNRSKDPSFLLNDGSLNTRPKRVRRN